MDLTDAMNTMTWSAKDDTGSPGVAIWHIFPAEDSDKIRQFLREQEDFSSGLGDPIHSQSLCLTPRYLARLEAEHGVHPYTIHQKPGNAVFIPAGCAHQVRLDNANSTLLLMTYLNSNRSATPQTPLKSPAILSLLNISPLRRSSRRSSARTVSHLVVARMSSNFTIFSSTHGRGFHAILTAWPSLKIVTHLFLKTSIWPQKLIFKALQ